MAAVDAQLFWLSAKVPNDQFLLYAFGGTPADIEAAVGGVRGRAGRQHQDASERDSHPFQHGYSPEMLYKAQS